jgi:broad specificity phosphatase PhoE
MPAAKIMLIRHAEKPNGDGGPGLMPNGVDNPRALTLTGWKRANALVGLFNPADGASPRPPLATPRSLFASGSESLRPKQTIAPLATALNLSVRSFLKGQEPELVAAVKAAEDPVLISWQHEAIPEIANLIRGSADGVPPKWPAHVYDLVWVLDLQASGAWSFAQVPELVMPGDSEKLIGLDGKAHSPSYGEAQPRPARVIVV